MSIGRSAALVIVAAASTLAGAAQAQDFGGWERDWSQEPPYYRGVFYGGWPGGGVFPYYGWRPPHKNPCFQTRRVFNGYFTRVRPVNVCSNFYRWYNPGDDGGWW